MSSDENILTSKPELLYRFPWLSFTKIKFKEIGKKNPNEFVEWLYKKYWDKNKVDIDKKIESIFEDAINNLEIIRDFSPKDGELNIYIYWMLKIILFLLNNQNITNRIANLYSKNAKTQLELLRDEKMEYLYWICSDLGLDVQYYEYPIKITAVEKTNLSVHFIDFIKMGINLRDDYRKLVNNSLSHEYVFISKNRLIRLLQEYVRNEILKFEKTNKSQEVPKERTDLEEILTKITPFKITFEKIKNLIKSKKIDLSSDYTETIKYKEGKDLSIFFPPCIKFLLSKVQQSQNLIHNERLFLVFFLNSLKYPIDQIINIFKTLPDFDDKIARYQIEFAIKKGYSPHSCAKLETLGICQKDNKIFGDEICREGFYSRNQERNIKITHPLFFINVKESRYYKELKKRDINGQKITRIEKN